MHDHKSRIDPRPHGPHDARAARAAVEPLGLLGWWLCHLRLIARLAKDLHLLASCALRSRAAVNADTVSRAGAIEAEVLVAAVLADSFGRGTAAMASRLQV